MTIMAIKMSFKKIFIRFFIVCFWILLIFLFLFSPHITNIFGEKKSLNIFIFPQLIDAEYVTRFEKKTGIKLNISYYENNDELLVKMRKTKGVGYDVIIPSDYAIEILIREGLIQKIDKSQLHFLHNIDDKFLKKYFDPNNDYSIPYLWETYKIGINKNFYKDKYPPASWKLAFDQNFAPKCIVMINNAREAVLLAAFYLFGSIDNLDKEKIKKIKELLIKQKEWVEVYTDIRSDYLLASETCPVAIGVSGEIWQATRFDKDLDFLIPKEGTFMLIDSVSISSKSKKYDLIYKFINYIYRPDVMGYHVHKYSLFPVTKDVKLEDYFVKSIERIWNEAKKIDFFRNVLSEEQLNEIWIELKSR